MKILVQKFGGTSVSSEENRKLVVKKIKNAMQQGYTPVVVVSAMGRTGAPYATDTLLSLVEDNFKRNNPQAIDILMACGEILSTVIICDDLYKEDILAVPLTGGQAGIKTNNVYNNATILEVKPDEIYKIIQEGKIPVVAGFQGISEDGFITTLGRGGSDVTGAILGAALKAEEVQIYTDVDGIMTADPRIVSDATLIQNISYDEVFQFADQGAKVIHPRAVEISRKYNIPLVIKNTLTDCEGTIISNFVEDKENIITGITHMNNRVQIRVSDNNEEAYYNLFDILAEENISIDLINVFPKEKIFTITNYDLDKFVQIAQQINLPCSYVENCSKIAIIGSKMRGIPGVMAKILKALTREKIEVLQTADSHMTIWCLVESKHTDKAINALHKEFNLG
ncbi:aspartate kinase [Clostridium sp.]|uniref:aspartate kinase n=1 Tax=Clostridium sp. TaxID=1506 RepID=UPI002FC9259B